MAQVERNAEERRGNKRERAKQQRGRRASANGSYELGNADWSILVSLVLAFDKRGGAVRLGRTRDGGALAVGCYLDDDYATEYIKPTEDLYTAALEIIDAWVPSEADWFAETYAAQHREPR